MKVVFPSSPDFAARVRAGKIASGADANEAEQEIAGRPPEPRDEMPEKQKERGRPCR
jgi:hypothetical protein